MKFTPHPIRRERFKTQTSRCFTPNFYFKRQHSPTERLLDQRNAQRRKKYLPAKSCSDIKPLSTRKSIAQNPLKQPGHAVVRLLFRAKSPRMPNPAGHHLSAQETTRSAFRLKAAMRDKA
ncbi:hypothetical protein [Oleiharenicola lentus]|uniref:hypothetical protein n=1 Tax=Oleiharenicola lentus TaxID=2508720 RepID=UPI003F67C350